LGRIDMTVLFNAQVYLSRARGEPIHLIGVEFSKESRSVVGFEVALIEV
jgi:hypothetical protein